mmetsp:Transcript_34017/g.73563  ORF Transcript_34017/g.73563 Transcript_34017/m.73563 type:complete len:290 (+) Transcript_34017:384-1253(+)
MERYNRLSNRRIFHFSGGIEVHGVRLCLPQFAEGIDIFHFPNLLNSPLRSLGPFLVDVTFLCLTLDLLTALIATLALQSLAIHSDHGGQILLALGVPPHHALCLLNIRGIIWQKIHLILLHIESSLSSLISEIHCSAQIELLTFSFPLGITIDFHIKVSIVVHSSTLSALLPSLLGDSWLITLRFHGWPRSVCRGVIISGGGGRPGLCLLGKDGFSFLWRHCGRDRSSIQLGLLHGAHSIHGQNVPELLDLGSKTSQSSDVRHIRTGGDRRSWLVTMLLCRLFGAERRM